MSPVRGVVRPGVLEIVEWTFSAFRCRTLVVAPELRLPGFSFGVCRMRGGAPPADPAQGSPGDLGPLVSPRMRRKKWNYVRRDMRVANIPRPQPPWAAAPVTDVTGGGNPKGGRSPLFEPLQPGMLPNVLPPLHGVLQRSEEHTSELQSQR